METSDLTFEDFSGGITDNFIDCNPNKYENAENFIITENKKLDPIAGSVIYDEDKPQLPIGNQRVGSIIEFYDELLFQANKKLYFENGASWGTATGPEGADAFSLGDVNSVISSATWNNHLLLTNDEYSPTVKVFRDDVGDIQLRSAGLPKFSLDPAITSDDIGTDNYIFAFIYVFEYEVGTVTFKDFGPVRQVRKENAIEPGSRDPLLDPLTINGIPELANGVGENWDTVSIKKQIYRTVSNGEIFYFVAEIDNNITTYLDYNDDETISSNAVLYTEGGVLDNDPPPLAKTIHIVNGSCWYGNIKTASGEIISNRIYQSIIDDPDSVPATAYVDVEDEIVAISSYLNRPIVLCKRSVYSLDGSYDEIGGGAVTYQKISDTLGCVSGASVVQIQTGVVFASQEGFAYTDGFTTIKISQGFNRRYRDLVVTDLQKKRIYGSYDRMDGRVWFSTQRSQGGSDDVDSCFILDTRYGINADSSFTTAGGMDTFAPTATIFKDGNLIRGDRRGYIFRHSDELLSYPTIDTTKPLVSDWFTEAVKYDFTSMATSFGNNKYRKFVPRTILRAENVSNLSTKIISLSDLGTREKELPFIQWRGNFIWGDALFTWGDEGFTWGDPGLIEEMRRFDGDDMRCSYRQLKLTNAEVTIIDSASLDTVTVNPTINTVTVDTPTSVAWPQELGGYHIYFETDNYGYGHEILSIGVDTIVVENDNNGLVSGAGQNWKIIGYPKDELLKLINITMVYTLLGQQQNVYSPPTVGG